MLVDAINQPHPTPAVPQSCILLLLVPEVPFPSNLVEHRGDEVKRCGCLTCGDSSGGVLFILGNVGRPEMGCGGGWPLLLVPATVGTGDVRNPGQSQLSSSGTGSSGISQTSSGHLPAKEETRTSVAGTSRTSPWTQETGLTPAGLGS